MEELVHRWENLTEDYPLERLARRRVIGEKVMLSRVTLYAGCDVPAHAHDNEQMAVVLSGRVRFGLKRGSETRDVVVEAGEVLHIPAQLEHSAYALEESLVLDVFSPPSEETGIDRAP